MINRRILSCVDRFWRLAEKPEPFPRSLESSVAWALPLAIVKLPRLGLGDVATWLERNGVPSAVDRSNHPIRAYLIARAGKGIIFIDGTDSADEQRFSLAHEVAHFLLDYLQPREEALKSFGEEILAVLDGNRSPTADERLKGIFRSIKLGTYSHLIDRSADGKVEKIEILQTEDNADLLALELLAPKRTVLHRMEDLSIRWKEDSAFQSTRQVLVKEFGLPLSVARSYANLLVLCKRPAPSMKEWLGM